MKTQDWVETSVFFDNDICPSISASGVSLSVIMIEHCLQLGDVLADATGHLALRVYG